MRKFTKFLNVLMVLLLSSGLMFAQMSKDVQLGIESKVPGASEVVACPAGAHYTQPSTSYSSASTSAEGPGYLVYSDFNGATAGIDHVRFYGLRLFYSGGWVDCGTDPMIFQIKFYDDNAGVPGTEQYSFDVYAYATDIGEIFGGWATMWQYETNLPTQVNMANGWMSIQSLATAGDCWFMWVNAPDYNPPALGFQWDGVSLNPTDNPFGFCFSGSPGPQDDLGVIAVNSPVTGPNGATETVDITVYNFGTTTLSNIPVQYIFDGGLPVGETMPGPLAPQTWANYSFTTTVDASAIGPHTIDACTMVPTDVDLSNDCWSYGFDTQPLFNCMWSIELWDDYGDGWNGGSLDVLVDGIVVLDDITLASGFGPAVFSFGVDNGSVVSTVYTAGSWAYENEYYIYDEGGVEVANDGVGGVDPVGIPGLTAYCNCCDHEVVMFDDYGDGWNGGYIDIYLNTVLTYPGVTLASGFGPESFFFSACTGDIIDIVYTAGSWAYENSYYVYDGTGAWLGEDGVGGVDPVGLNGLIGNCIPIACPFPTAQTAINITGTSADLGWFENGTATTWDIELVLSGVSPSGIPTDPGVTLNPYPYGGLTGGTAYDWYVRADCGGSQSVWFGPHTFTTLAANIICAGALEVTCGNVYAGSTVGAGNSAIPDCNGFANTAPDVWYYYVGTGDMVSADLCNGNTPYDSRITVFEGTCANLICVDANDDYCGLQSRIDWYAEAGITYYIMVHGYSTNSGAFEMTIDCTSPAAATWIGGDSSFGDPNPYEDWFGADNWDVADVPGPGTDVIVPTGGTYYPTPDRPGACNDIRLLSDAAGTATILGNGNIMIGGTGTFERYYTDPSWHLVSSPITDAVSGMYTGMYLQSYDEATQVWTEIIPIGVPLNPAQGYGLWTSAPFAGVYNGTLGTGPFGLPVTNVNPFGWNLSGNPYPSWLDWELVTPVNPDIDGAIY
ncbi:MAG: hypothetical protein K8R53_04035 [Bacteroidales bacterium]|nr:hypothetical protein [Bacteroidales bacterium]